MARIYTLEGNIGAGKTTFLNRINDEKQLGHDVEVLLEPVDDWLNTQTGETSILELFYKDKPKWSFPFQMLALLSRINKLRDIISDNPNKTIIIERSYLADAEVFAKMLYESNYLSDMEWNIYIQWYKTMIELVKINIDGIIYLCTSPNVCAGRIRQRNRDGEENIDLPYLEKIHKKHEAWLRQESQIPVLFIDANKDIDTHAIQSVLDFIHV
jgi:deoxycitidine kinase